MTNPRGRPKNPIATEKSQVPVTGQTKRQIKIEAAVRGIQIMQLMDEMWALYKQKHKIVDKI